jgi:hypothetical protein
MFTNWGEIEKGGRVMILRREDVPESLPGHVQREELLLVYSLEGEKHGHGIQCSRLDLADLLRSLAPAEVKILRPDAQLEAAVRQGTGEALH